MWILKNAKKIGMDDVIQLTVEEDGCEFTEVVNPIVTKDVDEFIRQVNEHKVKYLKEVQKKVEVNTQIENIITKLNTK